MLHEHKKNSIGKTMILLLVILNVIIIREAFLRDEIWYPVLLITLPLLAWFHEQELRHGSNREKA